MDISTRRLIKQFARAKKLYEDATDDVSFGQDPSGPWVVATNIDAKVFERWSELQEEHWHLAYDENTKTVYLFGDPSLVHEATAGTVHDLLFDSIRDALPRGEHFLKYFRSCSSPRYRIINGWKEPDMAMAPRGWPNLSVAPLIVEVAYRNETFEALKQEVLNWVRGPHLANLCLGIQVYDKPPAFNAQDPKLTLVWQRKGQAEQQQEMQFGKGATPKNDRPNNPAYMFYISLQELWGDPQQEPLPATLSNIGQVSIDLFELRENIIKVL